MLSRMQVGNHHLSLRGMGGSNVDILSAPGQLSSLTVEVQIMEEQQEHIDYP